MRLVKCSRILRLMADAGGFVLETKRLSVDELQASARA